MFCAQCVSRDLDTSCSFTSTATLRHGHHYHHYFGDEEICLRGSVPCPRSKTVKNRMSFPTNWGGQDRYTRIRERACYGPLSISRRNKLCAEIPQSCSYSWSVSSQTPAALWGPLTRRRSAGSGEWPAHLCLRPCRAPGRTCRVQRRSPDFALRLPGGGAHGEQVLEDQRVALSAGNVETVPAIFVLQKWVGAMFHEVLDHLQILPCAGHHQRSPKANQEKLSDGRAAETLQVHSWVFRKAHALGRGGKPRGLRGLRSSKSA